MATVASSRAAQLLLSKCSPNFQTPLGNASRIAFTYPNIQFCNPIFNNRAYIIVRASEPQKEEQNGSPDDSALLSQEDLNYLMKLGVGSVVGAAAIKYGSAVFPQITRPNITEALWIISFLVIVAILLLISQSRSD